MIPRIKIHPWRCLMTRMVETASRFNWIVSQSLRATFWSVEIHSLEIMKKKKKSQKPLSAETLLAWYRDPLKPSSLGGLTWFAKANKISTSRAWCQSDQHCQIQSRVSLSLDCGGPVFETCLGSTCEEQDGQSSDRSHGQDLERGLKTHQSSDGWQEGTLQQDVSRIDKTKKAFIIFRRAVTWKPVWWNGLTVHWNSTCAGTSPCRTRWTLSPSCKIWSEGTIARIIAVSRGLPDQVTQANSEEVWETLYGNKGKFKKL